LHALNRANDGDLHFVLGVLRDLMFKMVFVFNQKKSIEQEIAEGAEKDDACATKREAWSRGETQ
jgi:hypothetical protein